MSGPWTEKRAPAAERFTAWCRTHAPGIILAAALAAAIVVVGYVALGPRLAPKIELIGAAPPGAPIATGTAAVRDTVAWRDETGTVFRAKVDPRELEGFLQARRKALEAVRTETREQAS